MVKPTVDPEFQLVEITKEEFEAVWVQAVGLK